MHKYLREKEDFPDNWVRVREAVVRCLFCACVNIKRLLQAEKIPSNKNPLTKRGVARIFLKLRTIF